MKIFNILVCFCIIINWWKYVHFSSAADGPTKSQMAEQLAVVSAGHVDLLVPSKSYSYCVRNSSRSAFTCTLKYGSWVYNGDQVDILSPVHVDLSDLITNRRYKLLSTSAVREVNYYACCPEPYVHARFLINLRERSKRGGRRHKDRH